MSASRGDTIPARVTAIVRGGVDAIVGRHGDGRVPALDFLRAMAVITVVCGHWVGGFRRAGGTLVGVERLPLFRFGWTGVDLFFVLSGYLIGRQLWKEAAASGTVVFPRFFARRALRIWPLYFFVCLVIAVFPIPGEGPLWLSDLLFFSNYGPHGVAGGWSLSTEEQFYILGPLLIIVLGRFVSLRGFFLVIAAGAAFTSFCRYLGASEVGVAGAQRSLHYAIHLHNDGLLVGLALALLFTVRRDWLARDDLSVQGWIAGSAVAAAGLALWALHSVVFNFLGIALVFGGLTLALLLDRGLVTRLVDRRVFHALSVLSYGMYFNHFVLVEVVPKPWITATVAWPPAISYLLGAAVLIGLSALLSTFTYVLVEHPFLVLRDRWMSPQARPGATTGGRRAGMEPTESTRGRREASARAARLRRRPPFAPPLR